MEDNLLVFRAYEVIDDVRGGGITAGIAEPLGANETFDYRSRRVDATIAVAASAVKDPCRSRG